MRRRIVLYGTATTAAVVIAFLLPLSFLVKTLVADRALDAATQEAQGIAVIAAADDSRLQEVVDNVNAPGVRRTTVFLPDGRIVGDPVEPSASIALARSGQAFTADTFGGKEILIPVEGPSGLSVIRVFVPSEVLTQGVASAITTLIGVGIILVLTAVVVARVVARQMSKPVVAAAEVAERLADGDLAARVVPAGPPEVVELGRGLNRLGDRIDHLLASERELIADLSHRLRTPITALRLEVDAIRDPELAGHLEERLDTLADSVDSVIRAARRPVRSAVPRCDAATVVRDRVGFWSVLAEDQGRVVHTQLVGAPCPVAVDAAELGAAVDALIENVFAHTEDGAAFAVAVGIRSDGGVRVTVGDAGAGIPGSGLDRRGRSSSGSTGLGLDIARRCVETVGGTFGLGASPMGGVEVRLDFPA
jgi:signal transduction histidine kinase